MGFRVPANKRRAPKCIKRHACWRTAQALVRDRNYQRRNCVGPATINPKEDTMGFGKGALLWLIGIPLPIILLLALFWR